ncbi:hypothetical protein HY383_04200 [Candidatus Daviesbacteria bacterium]|nr:hypothetical protein [Candidatus Daviesbacteria bacterium]
MALNVPNDLFYRSTSPLDLNYRTSTSAQLTPYQTPGLISPLSSSGVVGYNVPQPAKPAPAPTPAPQQNNSGGGSLWDQISPFYQGWPEGSAINDFNSAMGGDINRLRQARGYGSSNSQPDLSAQLDSIYNPLFDTLQQQKSYINDVSLPGALNDLKLQQEQMKRDVEEQKQLGFDTIKTSQGALDAEKTSAFDEALRSYKALQQQSQARFGGRGSAGMAATEIASKEFARQQGANERSYTNQTAKLQDYAAQLDRYAFNQRRKIDENVLTEEQKIRANAQAQLMQIFSDESSIKSAKAGNAFQLLSQYKSQIDNLAATRQAALWDLEIWKYEQNAQIANNFSQLQQPTLDYSGFSGSQSLSPQSQGLNSYSLYAPTKGNKDDPYENLTNPFV